MSTALLSRSMHQLGRSCQNHCRLLAIAIAASAGWSGAAHAACDTLPIHEALRESLPEAQSQQNGGLGFHMWGVIVDRDGTVCAVAFTGEERGDQWPGSRAIAAQKANTANAFSLPEFALSTANLFIAVQPGGSLFGLQARNPVIAQEAYKGPAEAWGTTADPLLGRRIGGVNVFGGGLALYREDGLLLGALGVSGDTSCADHVIAWRARQSLGLNHVPAGVSPNGDDNIIFDVSAGQSPSGYGHPECSPETSAVATELSVSD